MLCAQNSSLDNRASIYLLHPPPPNDDISGMWPALSCPPVSRPTSPLLLQADLRKGRSEGAVISGVCSTISKGRYHPTGTQQVIMLRVVIPRNAGSHAHREFRAGQVNTSTPRAPSSYEIESSRAGPSFNSSSIGSIVMNYSDRVCLMRLIPGPEASGSCEPTNPLSNQPHKNQEGFMGQANDP